VSWAEGCYEEVAPELLPAARELVERAQIRPGERVVDIGCGTGSASLLAAEAGGRVTGVDPARRLLEVAAADAEAARLEAEFVEGDAANVPLADGSADAVISSFGVIFAPDPRAAADEVARVVAPDGRFVFSAWKPGTAIGKVATVRGETLAAAAGRTLPERFPWHELDAVGDLLGPHGFALAASDHEIAFTAPSTEEFVAREYEVHPMWAVARDVLGEGPELDQLRWRALEIYRSENEDLDAFRVTSGYAILVARRA
jgi:SAM-dependent methyltransferase